MFDYFSCVLKERVHALLSERINIQYVRCGTIITAARPKRLKLLSLQKFFLHHTEIIYKLADIKFYYA